MNPYFFQTIIIGAGPAGLMAGRYLKDYLILEKEKEIGRPIQCGEAISRAALERHKINYDPAWISAHISHVWVIAPSGKKIKVSGKETGYILDRSLFEKSLAEQFKSKIKLNSKVIDIEKERGLWKVKTEKGEIFQSEYLIGADGPLSVVRQKVFNQKLNVLPALDYLVKLEKSIDNSTMRMYFDKEKFPSGYAWIFPKSKNTANIGLGGLTKLKERFEDFLERVVRTEFGNYKILENKSGTITWGGAKITLFEDNAFLVGDAGGLVDPIFGGGIDNAMVSGKIAAQCVLKKTPHLYERKIKALPSFSKDLLLAQKILYSMPNSVLNQLAEALEKKDIFYIKTLPGIIALLSKNHLRRNFSKILKFFLILEKNTGSFV